MDSGKNAKDSTGESEGRSGFSRSLMILTPRERVDDAEARRRFGREPLRPAMIPSFQCENTAAAGFVAKKFAPL
jgi:hypothetical protein